jgi:hypothetical protein
MQQGTDDQTGLHTLLDYPEEHCSKILLTWATRPYVGCYGRIRALFRLTSGGGKCY